MIDWLNLLNNSIWIIAAALALSVLSLAYYRSQKTGEKLKFHLSEKSIAVTLNISGALFCLGLALTSDRWWEIVLWIVFMGLFGYQIYLLSKKSV